VTFDAFPCMYICSRSKCYMYVHSGSGYYIYTCSGGLLIARQPNAGLFRAVQCQLVHSDATYTCTGLVDTPYVYSGSANYIHVCSWNIYCIYEYSGIKVIMNETTQGYFEPRSANWHIPMLRIRVQREWTERERSSLTSYWSESTLSRAAPIGTFRCASSH